MSCQDKHTHTHNTVNRKIQENDKAQGLGGVSTLLKALISPRKNQTKKHF